MKKRPLFWHILPAFLAVGVLSVAFLTLYAYRVLRQVHEDRVLKELRSVALITADRLGAEDDPLSSSVADRLCRSLSNRTGFRLTVVAAGGRVIGDSHRSATRMDDHSDRPEIAAALAGSAQSSTRYSPTLQRDMIYHAVPYPGPGNARAAVRAAVSVEEVHAATGAVQTRLFLAGSIIAAGAALMGLVSSKRISLSLERVRAWVGSLAAGELDRRRPFSPVAEIDVLTNAMHRMAEQLNRRIELVTEQRDEQAALFSCMVEGVLAVDRERHLIKINQAAADLFGVDLRVSRGSRVLEVIRNADLHALVNETLESSEPVEREIFLPDAARYLQVHGTTLKGAATGAIGAVLVLHDITRLRRLETMRRDFVANVSHELKTPITSIKGFAETLLDGKCDGKEERNRFLGIIARQANRLQAILEDLLTLSSIEHESGGDVELLPGRVAGVIDSAVRACQAAAMQKRIRIEVSNDGDIVVPMRVQLLEQAVMNLLDNAIKYSEPETTVRVSAARSETETRITVRDEGPGIPREHLDRIFERFYRVDKGRSRQLGGTGLGLAIVKRVAMAHRGSVQVESRPGRGSAFSIVLPQPPTPFYGPKGSAQSG